MKLLSSFGFKFNLRRYTKSDTLQLFLPKKSLPPGTSYTLRFDGRQAANPSVSSSVEFDFYVQSAALEAVITGGAVLLSEGVGTGLHSSTYRLNVSPFCGIGGASRGCSRGV
jgi:hypothetical protein